MRFLVCVALFLVPVIVPAIDTGIAFEDPAMQARYENLIDEVRCLKCQNQTIKDSNAFLASDLRREIRRLMVEGKTDEEIFDFLVTRYGEFALYRPRKSGKTLFLWLAPLVLVLAGGLIAVRVVRRRMTMPIDDTDDVAVADSRSGK
ncbi:MAG: cytochrome c-type biogenesis protein [Woeseia sp.]